MGYLLLGLILLWFLLGVASAVFVAWHVTSRPISWLWLAPVLIGGSVLGWQWSDLEYFAEPDLRIEGFPLPVAAFERDEDDRWIDYPGPPFFLFANFIIGLTSPLAVCAGVIVILRWTRRRRTGLTEKPSVESGPSPPSP